MTLLLFEQDWRDVWNGAEPTEPVGAIFTKSEITEFIMDLAGYSSASGRLFERRLLEPSCGDGAFLTAAIRRLLESEKNYAQAIDWFCEELVQAIKACDVNSGFVMRAREIVVNQLKAEGCPESRAVLLAGKWIEHSDFLLKNWSDKFDYVVGNPPYVRLEDIPNGVMSRYRELFPLCADRADLYIAFFEQSLRLLGPTGRLAFICANRFTKNLYGQSLRQHIAEGFRVSHYVNLEHTQPFVSDVSAYPCITVIDRQHGAETRATTLDNLNTGTLEILLREKNELHSKAWSLFKDWYRDGSPWIATNARDFGRHVDLAARHPVLEDSAPGTRVGIGVATGNDEVFILPALDPSIEATCQLPLVMARDITPAAIKWSGHYLVNPYESTDESGLRDLTEYPDLRDYFERHRMNLEKRHTAKKNPETWFRTIDRVSYALLRQPKLLLPDIQAGGVVGLDDGKYYPHHNLYWITSTGWNLRALQALLRSTLVLEQVKAISVQMRGGSVRYQAQVLRKLRIPRAKDLPAKLKVRLAAVAGSADQQAIDAVAAEAYNLAL